MIVIPVWVVFAEQVQFLKDTIVMVRFLFFHIIIWVCLWFPVTLWAHKEVVPIPLSHQDVSIPTTIAEVKAYKPYLHPPVNVMIRDQIELLQNAVFVHNKTRNFGFKHYPANAISVLIFQPDGYVKACTTHRRWNGSYVIKNDRYFFTQIRHDDDWYPGFLLNRRKAPGGVRDGNYPLYDPTNGNLIFWRAYTTKERWHSATFMTRLVGHLQYDIPRAVYQLCPDFPSAVELGLKMNEAQTAVTYDDLIKQHPGQRVLRPDLVTPDARKYGDSNESEASPSQNDSIYSR